MLRKKQNVILGAGPAGLACAMELYNNGINFIVIEKDKQVGGLAKTYRFGKFKTDNGPHRFFSKNKYLYEFVENLLKDKWIKVKRSTRQYIDGKFYDYPINAFQAFHNIGLGKTLKMFLDYIFATFQYRLLRKKIRSFEDYIISSFGRSLGEFNMLNYTEKLWGIPCDKIHPDWAEQRIKGLNFREALANAFKNSLSLSSGKNKPKTLVDEFYYPSLGTGLIYESIERKIRNKNKVFLRNYPLEIRHNNKKVTSIKLNSNKVIYLNYLVSSIPITEFIKLLKPEVPERVKKAASNLRFRSQVYLFITFNKSRLTSDQWIYFPNKEVPFTRISEMKNFSKKMSPKNKTSLFVEYYCWENDDVWNKTKQELFTETMFWLSKLRLAQEKNVINYYHIKKKYTYPVYDLNYGKNLKAVKKYLDMYENLIYIGRPGRFKYTNQDHSLEMGILAAKNIVDVKRINVEDIGSEKKYFEKGYLK